ncbi:GSCFA domain-containing protein [Amaricoccus solimangrovi]|uniref:GSCFA domain-containing protein n=1 Tax=Amaricoccus solimangrovi TaxID=2589815 RepID=A0A501WK67_9RHOB|nr:GSCFA domain-containing protein [Amaricoccus solimangrovi]TPE48494.1 GSCFA domain-containing protein [Amaricoccus solimangrovi]
MTEQENTSPYSTLPPRAFWRAGVSERAPLDPGEVYTPRFPVTRDMRIATAGSCFAQHVGRALRESGFNVLDAEPLPASVPDALARRFGYRVFTGRYANIYTTRQLAQLFDEAEGRVRPAEPVWRRGPRFFDAQRPGVEPDGLESEELVRAHRRHHLARVAEAFRSADLFVFTFGLTEAWIHTASGTVYPTAPGTIAGRHDPEVYSFKNYDAGEVLADFEHFRASLKAVNPKVRFLVTVSPVPLTATASGEHVEVATCYSKSVLRAVCGMLVARHDDIDYFPSFEVITSQNARGAYFEPDLRSVSAQGVAAAMDLFKRAHGIEARPAPARKPARRAGTKAKRFRRAERAICEDSLLEAFAG